MNTRKTGKMTIWKTGAVLVLLLLLGCTHKVNAAATGSYPLKSNKTYQYDLDGDGKKESVKIKMGKLDDDRYYKAYVYVNGTRKLTISDKFGFYDIYAQVLVMSSKKVFIYINPFGDNDDGSKKIYQYQNGKFKKSINLDSMGRYASVQKVGKEKITMEIRRTWSAIGVFSYTCNLAYKNGKLAPDAKTYKIVSYSPVGDNAHPYLTAKGDIQIYKSNNTKEKSFVLKKGQKVKITKYSLNGKKEMFKVETKAGKTGWFVAPNDYEGLFEEAFGVG